MKTLLNTTVYKCEFCSKKLFRKFAMEHHEKYCNYKLENQPACASCQFLKETTNDIFSDDGNYVVKKAKAFECTKLNKMLYPLKVVAKGLLERYPETFAEQELMPHNCEHKKFYGI